MAGVKGKTGKYIRSDESKLKMSLSKIKAGIKPPSNLGKKFTKEHIEKIRLAKFGKKYKKRTNTKRYREYSIDWTETLKRSIRERDKYTCQLCSKQQGELTHHIHHIDYDKKNCNPDNLITLCISCHSKTNFKRDYWKEYFQGIMVN